jgi:hypothetical protein
LKLRGDFWTSYIETNLPVRTGTFIKTYFMQNFTLPGSSPPFPVDSGDTGTVIREPPFYEISFISLGSV